MFEARSPLAALGRDDIDSQESGVNVGVSPYGNEFSFASFVSTIIMLCMARPLRIEYEGAIYHVNLKGVRYFSQMIWSRVL